MATPLTAGTTPAGHGFAPRAVRAPRRTLARTLAGVAALLAVTVALAGPERLARLASSFVAAYVDAQHRLLQASGNLGADGRSEFAVLLHDGAGAAALREAVTGLRNVQFSREADLPGWAIVTLSPGDRDALQTLRALPQTRLVIPNRGLWICH